MATGLLELLKLRPLPVEKPAQPSATTVATSPDATAASRPPLVDDERTRTNAKRLTFILAKGYDEKIARARAAIDVQPMPAVKAKLAAEIDAFSAARAEVDRLEPLDGARRMKKLDGDALALAIRAEGLLNQPVGAQPAVVPGAPPMLSTSAAGPGGGEGGGGDDMSDAELKAKVKEWSQLGKVKGDADALREALGAKKDKALREAARAEFKRLQAEIAKGGTPQIQDVRVDPQHRGGDGGHQRRSEPDPGDPDGKKGESISEPDKKLLSTRVKEAKVGLDEPETKKFGRWLIDTHGEAEAHSHLRSPATTRAAVLQWMEETGWQKKEPERFAAVNEMVVKDRETGGREARGGGKGSKGGGDGDGGKTGGGATKGKGGTGDDHGGGKTGGGATKGKGGMGDDHGGGKTGGGSSKGTPDADGPASKISKATFNAANRKLSGLMSNAQAKINELAKTNPDAKELADAIDKANTAMDVKSFMDNPRAFVAGKSKQALIDLPFNHFTEKLEKSVADFEARFPSISDLNKTPVVNGASLGECEQRYNKAAAQLRLPKARKTLLEAFVLLGVNEKTPAKEIQKRLQTAEKMLAAMPDLKGYVDAYYLAHDAYAVALVSTTIKLQGLEDSYAQEVPRLAAGLRVRADALNRISNNLKEVADEIMDSPFIYFPAGEMAWFDFDHLAQRFGNLGGQMAGFANVVEQRKADYPGEIQRLDRDSKKLARSLLEMI